MPVKISYIVITWNGLHLLQDLLRSLERQLQREDVELIIADNGSTDGTQAYLQEISNTLSRLHVIELQENKGVAFARNRALEQAHGQYLFILDNDIQILDEAVEGMELYMDSHPECGICACKLLLTDGSTQDSAKRYPGVRQKIRNILHRGQVIFSYPKELEAGVAFEPVYVIGACQLVRAEVYRQIGALDERIFYGPEDADYCLRAHEAGWRIVYLPQLSMLHHCQRKTNSNPFTPLARAHIRALTYFYLKYKRV